MSTTELVKLSAAEMAAKIKAKEVSSRELVEAHLAVIEAAEPSVKPSNRPTPSTPSPMRTRRSCRSSPACRSPSRT